MLVAETCLLLAVRNALRTGLSLRDSQCDIEMDRQIPASAEDEYFAVVAAGSMPGQRHSSSGQVWDYNFAVSVTMYQKATSVARDRRRNIFIDKLLGMNAKLDAAILLIDYSYAITAAAKVLLVGTTAANGEYPEPFRSFTPDPSPRPYYQEPGDVAHMQGGDPIVGVARSVTFRQARFMMVRA